MCGDFERSGRRTEEIARGEEGNRARRALQRELEVHEMAIRDTNGTGTKKEQHDIQTREAKRRCEKASKRMSRHTYEAAGGVQTDLVDHQFRGVRRIWRLADGGMQRGYRRA